MVVVGVIVSLVLAFLWNWLVLWVGAKIIDSKEVSWRNCAILTVIGFAVVGVLIGFCALGTIFDSFLFGLLCLAAFVAGFWVLVRVTMNVLDITFWDCVGLCAVTWGLGWFASFLLGKLEGILPGVQAVTDWLPF